jgi:membrane protease YdiL (CAAX protease family)
MSMLYALLAYLPFLGVALAAQWSDRHRTMRVVTIVLLILVDGSIALLGLLAVAAGLIRGSSMVLPTTPGGSRPDPLTFGLGLLATSIVAPVFLIRPVRRALARAIPIDPRSAIHTTAILLAVFVVGLTISQLPLFGGLEALAQGQQIRFADLLVASLPIGLFAFVGVGYLVRRNWRATRLRLGLEKLTWRQAALVVGLAVGIVAAFYGIDWVWRTAAPDNYALLESVSEVLFGGIVSPWQGLVLSISAGVLEELLFRGAVQPRFGIVLTSLLFTAVHVQYGLSPATLEILIASLVLGWLRRRHNTTACILLHFLYDALALVVFPLLP